MPRKEDCIRTFDAFEYLDGNAPKMGHWVPVMLLVRVEKPKACIKYIILVSQLPLAVREYLAPNAVVAHITIPEHPGQIRCARHDVKKCVS
jgi:hypothetical protein